MKKLAIGILVAVFVIIAVGAGLGIGSSNKPASAVVSSTTSTTRTSNKVTLTVNGLSAAECEAYAAQQTARNPGQVWTAHMDGAVCVVERG